MNLLHAAKHIDRATAILRESNDEATQSADHHDDKPDERANRHTDTGPGDLDTAGRPLKAGS